MSEPYNLYPPLGFHFKVTFSMFEGDFSFQSVSGLTAEVVTETYSEGGLNRFDYELPVKTQYPDLVLKRGLWVPLQFQGAISDLQQWCSDMMESLVVYPCDLSIQLLNPAGKPIMAWNVRRAWPKKWVVSDFNAEENQIVIETIELHYDYFSLLNKKNNAD